MSITSSYEDFLYKRKRRIVLELIYLDLMVLPEEKKKKKEFLNSFLENRQKIFLKLIEQNVIEKRRHQHISNQTGNNGLLTSIS